MARDIPIVENLICGLDNNAFAYANQRCKWQLAIVDGAPRQADAAFHHFGINGVLS